MNTMQQIFRFAPSPNGALHLGHAFAAWQNMDAAARAGGTLLLRLEDIDTTRCTNALEAQMLEDLHWIGMRWRDPVRRQSDHFDDYLKALDQLRQLDLVYPAFLTRGEIRDAVRKKEASQQTWPRDPDGTPLYPGVERNLSTGAQQDLINTGRAFAWRLNTGKAIAHVGGALSWQETGQGPQGQSGTIAADPAAWGDVVIARKDIPTSYHLSVVVDDGIQGVSDVIRGHDLFAATSIHRLLQVILGLQAPLYCHHLLIGDSTGRKLSKSDRDTSIRSLRNAGLTPDDVRALCERSEKL